jgi:autoinducer 2-degrading protein
MLVRLVKLTIAADQIETFKIHFDSVKDKIRSSKGNLHVELWQDMHDPQMFFTHSHWESYEDLEAYRQSAFFDDVWRYTKTMFSDKAQAWSFLR